MSRPPLPILLAIAAVLPLGGCLTPHAKPGPSAAVVEARKGEGRKTLTCQATLADVSPSLASFPFDASLLDEEGTRQVSAVAAWLACHPGTPVVITPSAERHGTPEHQKDLAGRRAQAVLAALRADGASSTVVHALALGAADPLTGPHVVIQAQGRGW
jgi:outer membrane protein OmpA-like peptidoglycan-associated protein